MTARPVLLPARRSTDPAVLGVVDGWIVADGVSDRRWRVAVREPVDGADHAGRRARHPRCPQRLERAGRHRRRAAVRRSVGGDPRGAPRRSPVSSIASSRGALVDGVRFVNDSQGTQPDAVIAALAAFPAPVVLIAGGRDKGVDLSALGPVVAERAIAAVLIGESGPDLERRFRDAGLERTERARDARRGGRPRRRARAARRSIGRSRRRGRRPCC